LSKVEIATDSEVHLREEIPSGEELKESISYSLV
jgi:hypothetical protein